MVCSNYLSAIEKTGDAVRLTLIKDEKHMKATWIILPLVSICFVACGKKSNEIKSVTGTASIVLGATGTEALTVRNAAFKASAETDSDYRLVSSETWLLSPDQAKITFRRIDFVAAGGESISAGLSGCTVTYDRSRASGSNLLDCPFTLQLTSEDGEVSYKGTYVGLYIYFDRTIPIRLNGNLSGIYSDPNSPTLLQLGNSAGNYVNYQVGGGSGDTVTSQIYLNQPFVVTDTGTPSIKIVTDLIHTIRADVSGGTASFTPNSGVTPVELIAIPGSSAGHAEYYSNVNTIESLSMNTVAGGNYVFARLFYADETPVRVNTGWLPDCFSGNVLYQAFAADAATSPIQDSVGNRAGGYLGQAGSGELAWALGTDWRWSGYGSLMLMPRGQSIGDSVDLKCLATTSVPTPPGGTYASGAPTILNPSNTIPLTLLAK